MYRNDCLPDLFTHSVETLLLALSAILLYKRSNQSTFLGEVIVKLTEVAPQTLSDLA